MNNEKFDMVDYARIFAIIISLIAIVISFTVIFKTQPVTGDDVKPETNDSQLLGPVSDITYKYDTSSIDFLGKSEGYSNVFSYYEDLEAKHQEADGLSDMIIQTYSRVITDEEREKVSHYVMRMKTALTIQNYQEDEELLNEIIANLDKRQPVIGISFSKSSGSGYSQYQGRSGILTRSGGVNWFNGRKETWYSQRVKPGGGLRIPGRHVASDGTIRDADGYICVAASDLPKGTVIETSLGMGKVYDTGCDSGTTDIYVDW